MRENKKNFFHSLLQLTILVYFFRQSTRLSTDLLLNNNVDSYSSSPTTANRPFLLNYNQLLLSVYDSIDLQTSSSISNSLSSTNNNYNNSRNTNHSISAQYTLKESRQYVDDLRILNLINKINNTAAHLEQQQQNQSNNFSFFVAPATYSNPTTSHKELINLSETRLLLNSIELNWNNQLTKEVILIEFFHHLKL